MHGWSDKRSEPDSRHPRNCTRGDINKTIKFADSRITFPHRPSSIPPVELYRSTSSSPSLSCPLLFHPCFNPRVVAQVGSGRVCGEPASLLFLMYENLCTLGRKKRRRKRREGYVHTATNLDLLDGCCFLFTPFPPLFTRRLPLSLVWIRHPLHPKEGVDQWERRRRERKYSARFRQFSRV